MERLIALGIPILAVVAILMGWALATYNRLVRLRQLIRDSWANVETELNRRYDLVPNLVETVRGYAAHEREVLRQVVEARTKAIASNGQPPADQEATEIVLVTDLKRLIAVVEAYPDLKASTHFLQLQRELVTTEDRIQLARRIYNANVRELNTKIEQFPAMLVASTFGFEQASYFQVESITGAVPSVQLD